LNITTLDQPDEKTRMEIKQQAGMLLSQVAGYIGVRAMDIGLRFGFFEEIAKNPKGITAEALANKKKLDPFFTQVWCRSAYAANILEMNDSEAYLLAPHIDTLLLDQDSPSYIGALPGIFEQPEIFDRFAENLPSGEGIWWDQCSPTWLHLVGLSGRAFYNRLVQGGLNQVPGLSDCLKKGANVMELACGAGVGLVQLALTYPECNFVGVDGDSKSLELARKRLQERGLENRVSLVHSTLEDVNKKEEFDLVLINVTMHECRDIEKVTDNVNRSLKSDGYFVISDFPIPEKIEDCRTIPGQIMCGIQFFEALIDDQLLLIKAYIDLLNAHGFRNGSSFDLTPVHTVVYAQK
jgi:SAM-dependent methyltransferase